MRFLKHPLLSAVALLVALVLGLAATLLLFEHSIRVDGLRERVAGALSRALGAEAHIDGPLRVVTGLHPGLEVEGLRLAGRAGDGTWRAETKLARLRLDLWALLGREIVLTTADLQDARLCATLDARGRTPHVATRDSSWSVGGIDSLRMERVALIADASCVGEPWARIALLEGHLPASQPLQWKASGTLQGAPWRAELRGPPFSALAEAAAAARFELSAELANARLRATVDATPSSAAVSADVVLEADELLPLTELLDAPLKSFGPLHARAHVQADASRLAVRVDQARLPPAAVAGALSLDWSGTRPRAALELHGEALDAAALRQWLDASLDRARLQPGRLTRRLMSAVRASDGTLSVRLGRVDAGPVALDALGAEGGWADGVLRARLAARYGQSPVDGSLEADMRGDELAVALQAQGRALVLPESFGVTGSVAGVTGKLSLRGVPGAPRETTRATLALRDVQLRLPFARGRMPPLAVATARAEWLGGETLRVNGAGSLGAVRLQAQGELAVRERRVTADLEVGANAESLAGLPLQARGRAVLGEADWRLEVASLRLGQTHGRAGLAGTLAPAKRPIAAHAEFELLDVAELTQGRSKADTPLWERALLPRGASLPDADVTIEAESVALPQRATLKLKGGAQLRGGRISATLQARELSIPQFGASVGRVALEVDASGGTLRELAAGATVRLEARDARIATQRDGVALEAALTEARLSAAPDSRTSLSAAGSLFELPLQAQASAAPLATLLPSGDGEFDVSGRIGEVALQAAWARDSPIRLRLDAPRLDALDALLARKLPPVGPVSVEASVHGLGTPQQSADATLELGESRVSGRVAVGQAADRRPTVDVALTSSHLRIEDLGVPQWAERAESAPRPSAADEAKSFRRLMERAEAQAAALGRTLRKFDARVELSVARLTSGAAELGRAELAATLERGHLRVAPLKLDASQGKLSLSLDADMSTDEPGYRLEGELDQFRYGALLRGIDWTRKDEGSLSLKLALSARGRLGALAPSIAGTADFLLFPAGVGPRALSLWGGGLLRLIGGALDKEKGARVNCAVARFNVSGGIAKSEALMLDSTSTRAAGELEVNLVDYRLKGFMAPKGKSAHMLSPQVPVGIGGTLDDPRVGVEVTGIPRAAVRTFYFLPAYLYDSFLSGSMPADGSEDCVRAYRRISTQ